MSQQQNKTRPAISKGQALAIAGGLLAIAAVIGVSLYVIGGTQAASQKPETQKKSPSKKTTKAS